MLSKSKLFLLLTFLIITIFFWDSIFLSPIKVFVVYLHEISHALATIITGGKVYKISIGVNESGAIFTKGGNLIIISLAGYIGSIIWGGAMVYTSLSNRFAYVICIIIGITIPVFTHLYFFPKYKLLYWFLFAFGSSFLLIPLISRYITRFLLLFFGSISCIYSIYDLTDFFKGAILETDAGIIATMYSDNIVTQEIIAIIIAILISLIGIFVMFFIVKKGLQKQTISNVKKKLDSQEEDQKNTIQQKEEKHKNQWQDFQEWKEYKKSRNKYK